MSGGANMIVKKADEVSGFRIANSFQEALKSEAQDFPTGLMPYDDLESNSHRRTPQPQPIILGFSLPPHYFSCTASTRVVVNVFCQLVSFIHDREAWDKYTTRSTPTDHSLAPVRDSSSFSSFDVYLDIRPFVISKDPGLRTKGTIVACSFRSARLCVQTSSRLASVIPRVFNITFFSGSIGIVS